MLGPDHPDTLTSRNNLAYAYRVGRATWTGPSPCSSGPSPTASGSSAPTTPTPSTSRNNLAGAYESAGDLDRAIPLYERTLADRERVLGPDHPDTLTSRNNLAGAYESAGDLDRAIPLYEADPGRPRAGPRPRPPRHPDLPQQPRRRLRGGRGTWTGRIPLYERTLSPTASGSSAPTTPTPSTSRNNLADAYRAAGGPRPGHPPVRTRPSPTGSGCSAPTTPTP